MLYEYIVTAFSVIVGILTTERLAISALILYGLLVLWILFSLLFSFQTKFSRRCKDVAIFVEENGINGQSYPKFIELASRLPKSFMRAWKTYEHDKKGLPSDYLKRSECLDLELTGGLFKQNRSVMKAYVGFFTTIIAILNLALAGSREAITGYSLAESLILPVVFIIISMLTYFLYTALRQRQYRLCVDDFNEMIDVLNEKAEENQIIICDEVSAIENFETQIFDNQVEEKVLEETEIPKIIFDDHTPVVGTDEVIEDNQIMVKTEEDKPEKKKTNKDLEKTETQEYTNLVSEESVKVEEIKETPKRGRGRPKKEKAPEGELIIKSDEEFEEVLAKAEKLMRKNEEPLSQSQQKRVEKALKELVDAMKKYKEEN